MLVHSDIRRAVSDFVAEAKGLCQRLLLSDRMRLNVFDLHILRAQLKVLDAEAANLEYLITASASGGRTTVTGTEPLSRTPVENNGPVAELQEGRSDLLKRAG